MSCCETNRVVSIADHSERLGGGMSEEIEQGLARIDADLARILGAVEPIHKSDDRISRMLLDVEEMSELRVHQVLRTEGGK